MVENILRISSSETLFILFNYISMYQDDLNQVSPPPLSRHHEEKESSRLNLSFGLSSDSFNSSIDGEAQTKSGDCLNDLGKLQSCTEEGLSSHSLFEGNNTGRYGHSHLQWQNIQILHIQHIEFWAYIEVLYFLH